MSKEIMVLNNSEAIQELIQTNMAGQLDVFNLDRIKVPAGGGTSFSVPALDGEHDEKTLTGIIIHIAYQNAYWAQSVDDSGGGSPPDCVARDAKIGVGDPGGDCSTCPLNAWGSDQKGGKGKECKNMLMLFMLMPDSILPVVVSLPPTSIRAAKNYFMRLTSASMHYYDAMSSIELEKTKNDNGIAYSTISIKMAEKLDEKGLKDVASYRKALLPALKTVSIQQEDIQE